MLVGPSTVGKSALAQSYFEGRTNEVELKSSNPSLGSHVGYVPAPESHRRDLVMPAPHGESVVALECWESPGEAIGIMCGATSSVGQMCCVLCFPQQIVHRSQSWNV